MDNWTVGDSYFDVVALGVPEHTNELVWLEEMEVVLLEVMLLGDYPDSPYQSNVSA